MQFESKKNQNALKGRAVSNIESYHLFACETWVNAVYTHLQK